MSVDRHALDDVLAAAPALAEMRSELQRATRDDLASDPLLALAPDAYVSALLGTAVGAVAKLSCPFHRTIAPACMSIPGRRAGAASLADAAAAFYDLGAALWDLQPRGREFLQLRHRLEGLLLGGAS